MSNNIENNITSYTFPITQANELVREYLNKIKNEEETFSIESVVESRQKLRELIDQIISYKTISGTADDIHNLSVELSRRDEYELACEILDYGLRFYPRNVDLLADYLQSGISCHKIEQCEVYYQRLSAIPHSLYTWRGYDFQIDYLLFRVKNADIESDQEYTQIYNAAISLVESYRRNFPNSEDSYKAEADIYALFNKSKEIELLKSVIENDRIKICPKCALRYAEIKFEQGDYDEAFAGITKALLSYTQPRKTVHGGYLYYMSGLLKLSKILSQENESDYHVDTNELLEIYSDFNIALPMLGRGLNEYKEGIKDKTNFILGKYNVKIPSEMENLNYFI